MTLAEISVEFPSGRYPFFYRPGTSDINMINQAFRDKAFDFSGLQRWAELRCWAEKQPKTLIVDAGANIGTAAVFLACTFPNAIVVALEPDDDNFSVLSRNAQGHPIVPLHTALSGRAGFVQVYGEGNASRRTKPAKTGVPSITMNDILAENIGTPFLAKIDIEGAEANVFSSHTAWIDQFPMLVIELHDWLFPGQSTSSSFLRAVAGLNRDFILSGEHVISIRNTP
jgi:FkbM family methyltransferase